MRKKMNSKSARPIRPYIDNRKVALRIKSQAKVFNRCPQCGEIKSINSFTVRSEICDNPQDIILYEICNTCDKRLIREAKEEEDQKRLIKLINKHYTIASKKYGLEE